MNPRRLLIVALVVLGASCTRGDGNDLASPVETEPTSAPTLATSPPPLPSSTGVDEAPTTTPAPDPTVDSTPAVSEVPDGIPGLDSDDQFCAAWSRFGGSFNVVAPIAAFGDDPALAEVVAAPTMVAAFATMFENWPDDLEGVRTRVESLSLGPLAERMGRNIDRLVEAGATDADLAAIDQAWLNFLDTYQPETPGISLELTGNLGDLIAAAVAANEAEEASFSSDTALQTDPVEEFYEYLRSCPDQGTLAGQDVPAG